MGLWSNGRIRDVELLVKPTPRIVRCRRQDVADAALRARVIASVAGDEMDVDVMDTLAPGPPDVHADVVAVGLHLRGEAALLGHEQLVSRVA